MKNILILLFLASSVFAQSVNLEIMPKHTGFVQGGYWYYVQWLPAYGHIYLVEEFDDSAMTNRTHCVFNVSGWVEFARISGEYHYRVTDFTNGSQDEITVYVPPYPVDSSFGHVNAN